MTKAPPALPQAVYVYTTAYRDGGGGMSLSAFRDGAEHNRSHEIESGEAICSHVEAYLAAIDVAIERARLLEQKRHMQTRIDALNEALDTLYQETAYGTPDPTPLRVLANIANEARLSDGKASVRTSLENALVQAGFPTLPLIETQNRYCSCEACAPWYEIGPVRGVVITMGWRKRVLHIGWDDPALVGTALFDSIAEHTTVDATYVHAWGYDKAAAYLRTLRLAIEAR